MKSLRLDERNDKIRKRYRRLFDKEGFTMNESITLMVRDFSAWDLSFDSLKRIIFDKKYGVKEPTPQGKQVASNKRKAPFKKGLKGKPETPPPIDPPEPVPEETKTEALPEAG